MNLPVGVFALVGMLRAPRSPRGRSPMDPAGQVTAVLALAALVFAVITGGSGGWTSPTTICGFLVAVLGGTAFLLVEARQRDHAVPLTLFRIPSVAVCTSVGLTLNFGYYGLVKLTNRYGPRLPLILGQIIQTVGMLGLLLYSAPPGSSAARSESPARCADRRLSHFMTGMRISLVVGAAVLAATTLGVALFLPGGPKSAAPSTPVPGNGGAYSSPRPCLPSPAIALTSQAEPN